MTSQPLQTGLLLGQQRAFPVAARVPRSGYGEKPESVVSVLEAGIGGWRWPEQDVIRPGPPTEPGERLAQGTAIFQRQDRVVISEFGVFVPRGIFGTNVDIHHQPGRMSDGSVSVLVYGVRRQRQLSRPPRLDCRAEQLWLEQHRAEFAGEWVALEGGRLLGHGADARTVYQTALSLGVAAPLLVKVELSDELPFGGW